MGRMNRQKGTIPLPVSSAPDGLRNSGKIVEISRPWVVPAFPAIMAAGKCNYLLFLVK
jgi:hypothetical protein